jgi:ABC-type nitrate/sulfonate/bicarbonate transport system substrate-binding protein
MIVSRLRRFGVAAAAVGVAAALAAACSSGSGANGGTTTDGLTNVTIQTAPGNVLPYLGYLAQNLGYFKQNGLNANFATLTTGLSSTAALNAGSLDVIFADPASTGPLIAKGANLRLILNEQTIQWRILVPQALAGKPFADVVRQLKVVGAPAASGGTASLIKLVEQAYGIPVGTIKVVADQSGAGVLSGSEQAVIVEPAASCILENSGLREAFSFAKAKEPGYPATLQQAIGIPDIGYWVLDSYAKANPKVISGLQAGLTKAEQWANDPKNLARWVKIMRASPLNNKTLDDRQYTACLSSVQGSFEPHFSTADAAMWSKLVKLEGILPAGLPDPSTWLHPGIPTS